MRLIYAQIVSLLTMKTDDNQSSRKGLIRTVIDYEKNGLLRVWNIKRQTNTPLIEDLGHRFDRKGENLLKENLTEGEEIKVKLKGRYGEALVVTNKRLYILKWGYLSGNLLGGTANAFNFNNITGVNLRKGAIRGYVEILTGANQDRKFNILGSRLSDNAIRIGIEHFSKFTEAVKLVRDILSEAQSQNKKTPKENHPSTNPLDDLERLSELNKKGIISTKEFEAKKKQLLGI